MRHFTFAVWYLMVPLALFCSPAFAQYGETVQYFPHAVAGGGAVTAFCIHNPAVTQAQVRIELFDPDGVEFHTRDAVISGRGMQTISVGLPGDPMRIGWARITAITGSFEATEFFQLSVAGQALPRVGVLPSGASSDLKFFAFVTGTTNTGIAVANPSETEAATVTLRRYTTQGACIAAATATLEPRHQLARFLNEDPWFPGLSNFEGTVQVASTQPVVLVMLRSDNSLLSSAAVLNPNLQYLTSGSITTDLIADEAVTGEKISDGAVTSEKIADGTITTADLAYGAVTKDKLNATGWDEPGYVLGTDGSQLRWQRDLLTLPFSYTGGFLYDGFTMKADSGRLIVLSMPATTANQWGAAVSVVIDEPVGWSGVVGESHLGAGVVGESAHSTGVYGFSSDGDGVAGIAEAAGKSGVYGLNNNAAGYAGFFSGRAHVTGQLTKGSGAFKIDHPLDPENKYLYHSFVESPDMKNVYDGVVKLDANGEAWVELPEWFGTLNRDFRYQLTCIGAFAPVFIAEKISNNHFKIAGGQSGMEVSWQVTGIRQDPYAEKNRLPVEEEKPANERGKYLHPDVYNLPKTMGINYNDKR